MAETWRAPAGASMVMLYGVFIDHAIRAKGISLEELRILRDQIQATVDSQGNLVEGLAALDKEIERRGGEQAAKAPASKSSAAGFPRRWLIHLSGVTLPQDTANRIEKRLGEVALEELAKVDQLGDLVSSPLSSAKSWGPGLGGATAGLWIEPRLPL